MATWQRVGGATPEKICSQEVEAKQEAQGNRKRTRLRCGITKPAEKAELSSLDICFALTAS